MTWQFEDTIALFEGKEVSVNGEDGEPICVDAALLLGDGRIDDLHASQKTPATIPTRLLQNAQH